jgi:hypothetical protein
MYAHAPAGRPPTVGEAKAASWAIPARLGLLLRAAG